MNVSWAKWLNAVNRAFYEYVEEQVWTVRNERLKTSEQLHVCIANITSVGAPCILWLDVVIAVEPYQDIVAGRMLHGDPSLLVHSEMR